VLRRGGRLKEVPRWLQEALDVDVINDLEDSSSESEAEEQDAADSVGSGADSEGEATEPGSDDSDQAGSDGEWDSESEGDCAGPSSKRR
jgi:hypothetical protein